MPVITVKDGTQIWSNHWGVGQPVVFSHGWPLSADAFEDQMFFLVSHGYRCIAHDRRSHGRSSQPWNGNDMDTHADDLAALCEALDLSNAIHIGHSTGGGEVSGPHFRDYHLMLDDQGTQIFAMTDAIAERVRKLGHTTLRSVGQIARLQRTVDNNAEQVAARDMLVELRDDNTQFAARMREMHALCDEVGDVASAGLLETWIDEAEGRAWFLAEASQHR